MDDIRTITATMNVAASPADVWRTMTDPHRLALWFGTLAGAGEPGGEVDIDVTATAEQVTAVITGATCPSASPSAGASTAIVRPSM